MTNLDLNELTKDHRVVLVTEGLAARALAEGYDLGDAIRSAFVSMTVAGARVAVLQINAVSMAPPDDNG